YEAADGFTCRAAVPVLPIGHLASQLSAIAGRFHGEPACQMKLVGITGTNGKTSVSQMLAQALNNLGQPCGVIGTLGSGMPGALLDHGMTTPDALSLQQQLAHLRDQGACRVSMEVSSHALAQDRVAALMFEVAVFTNLSRDHLDYHGDMAAYGQAKARLFGQAEHAVINLDDTFGRQLAEECTLPLTGYSLSDSNADLYCSDIRFDAQGISARLHTAQASAELRRPPLGTFNLSNLRRSPVCSCRWSCRWPRLPRSWGCWYPRPVACSVWAGKGSRWYSSITRILRTRWRRRSPPCARMWPGD